MERVLPDGTVPQAAQPPKADASAANAKAADIERMEQEYQEKNGIGGIRPETMARLGFSPMMLSEMFDTVGRRVEPMEIGALIEGTATQKVKIILGKLEVTYRITGGRHDDLIARISVKRRAQSAARIAKLQANADDVGIDYDEVRLSCELMLACGVAALGSRALTDPAQGSLEDGETTLENNLAVISMIKGHAFWLTWINFVWFQHRVRKAISEEVVKNG